MEEIGFISEYRHAAYERFLIASRSFPLCLPHCKIQTVLQKVEKWWSRDKILSAATRFSFEGKDGCLRWSKSAWPKNEKPKAPQLGHVFSFRV
jgi:hypothetical protein